MILVTPWSPAGARARTLPRGGSSSSVVPAGQSAEVLDPNDAVRFCRRVDAEAVLKREHLYAGARAVEHVWLAALAKAHQKDESRG